MEIKKTICDSIIASASIPFMVPASKINDDSYGDGGIMYASPLYVFFKEIYHIITRYKETLIKYKYYEIPETKDNTSLIIDEDEEVISISNF